VTSDGSKGGEFSRTKKGEEDEHGVFKEE